MEDVLNMETLNAILKGTCGCPICSSRKAIAEVLLQKIQQSSNEKQSQAKEETGQAVGPAKDKTTRKVSIPAFISTEAAAVVVNLFHESLINREEARMLLGFDGAETHWFLS